MAVYGYLIQTTISRQEICKDVGYAWNLAFTYLIALGENTCYLGWFKAAEVMINPFGSDEEDFEVLWLIDRHWGVVKRMLDEPWLDNPCDVRNESSVESVRQTADIPLPHTLVSAGELLLK
jgi:hypothetical protein